MINVLKFPTLVACQKRHRQTSRVFPICFSDNHFDLSLLSIGSTQEDLSHHICKIVDWNVKNQIKQSFCEFGP